MNWEELKNHDLIVYSTSWCPDCTRLEMRLKSKGVPFTIIDIDAKPEFAKELKASTGESSIPWVKIDNLFFVLGWHRDRPGRWNEEIFFKDIANKI